MTKYKPQKMKENMKATMPLMPRGTPPRWGKSALHFNIPKIAVLPAGRILRLFGVVCASVLCVHQAQAAAVATNATGVQLSIELRDGSHVVGKSLEDTLSLHSATLGDLKLAWTGIRSIEYAGTNTDTARLTATYGDVFAVTFAADTLRVETGFGQTELPLKLIRSVKVAPPAKPNAVASTEIARLAIELRDGSHVVGKSLDDALTFHSLAMGDLKLTWAGIRSIEYAGTNTEVARLTATNGDVYEVQFAAPAVRVETSFGKSDLPVKLIRSVRVSVSGRPAQLPPGVVGLWSGEGDGSDSAGTNNALLTAISFENGKVGQAFSFDGTSSFAKIPASPSLDVGQGQGLSILAWIKPSDVDRANPIAEWNNGAGWGVHFHLSNQAFEGTRGPGQLYANIVDTSGRWHQIDSPAGTVAANEFQHVALTYDKASGLALIYRNGVVVARQNLGSFTPHTSFDLYLGRRAWAEPWTFAGLMDEITLYNRALSGAEIQALCTAQNNGEPLPAAAAPPSGGMRPMYDSGLRIAPVMPPNSPMAH
jgi:hypothetical protein